MPGGGAAIKQPWRMGLSFLFSAYGDDVSKLQLPIINKLKKGELKIVQQMVSQRINSPLTSSCGRLFDAVSALLGLCREASFEAEAAIRLEMIIDNDEDGFYPIVKSFKKSHGALPMQVLIKNIVSDFISGVPLSVISARFHNTLARVLCETAISARDTYKINRVGLSGGVYQNCSFFERMMSLLLRENFEVITHAEIPANDGGLALGQIVIAAFGQG